MRDQRSTPARNAVISLDRAQLVGLGFFAVLSGGLMFGLGYASGKTRRQWEPQPAATGIAKVEQNHALQQELKKDNVDLTFYKALVEKDKDTALSKPAESSKRVAELAKPVEPAPEPQKQEPAKAEQAKEREPVFTSTLPAAVPAPAPQPELVFDDKQASGEGPLSIQVSAFGSEAEAQSYVKLLQAKGFKAQIVQRTISGKTWYKVRIGRFANAAAVEKYKQKLARENIPAWVVQAD